MVVTVVMKMSVAIVMVMCDDCGQGNGNSNAEGHGQANANGGYDNGGNAAQAANGWNNTGWGNGLGNTEVQAQNFRCDPELSCKYGDLVACPVFTNCLAHSLKSIHCSDFTVKGLMGVVCMLKK